VEKHCKGGQATDDNKVHVHCMLDIPKATSTHAVHVEHTQSDNYVMRLRL